MKLFVGFVFQKFYNLKLNLGPEMKMMVLQPFYHYCGNFSLFNDFCTLQIARYFSEITSELLIHFRC